MTNTKVKKKVALYSNNTPKGEYWSTAKRTIWRSHTGVECVKVFNEWHKVVSMRPNGFSPDTTLRVGPKYKVPKLPSKLAEEKLVAGIIERVEPLSLTKDERRVLRKLDDKEYSSFKSAMCAKLMSEL